MRKGTLAGQVAGLASQQGGPSACRLAGQQASQQETLGIIIRIAVQCAMMSCHYTLHIKHVEHLEAIFSALKLQLADKGRQRQTQADRGRQRQTKAMPKVDSLILFQWFSMGESTLEALPKVDSLILFQWRSTGGKGRQRWTTSDTSREKERQTKAVVV